MHRLFVDVNDDSYILRELHILIPNGFSFVSNYISSGESWLVQQK